MILHTSAYVFIHDDAELRWRPLVRSCPSAVVGPLGTTVTVANGVYARVYHA
jgi:hypothetical protein